MAGLVTEGIKEAPANKQRLSLTCANEQENSLSKAIGLIALAFSVACSIANLTIDWISANLYALTRPDAFSDKAGILCLF